MCANTPPAPDPNPGMMASAEAARDVAKIQQETARDYLDFAKKQYDENKGFLADIAQTQANVMKANESRAADYAEYEKNTFRPLQQRLINEAYDYNTEGKQQQMASQAAADVQSGYQTARADTLRNLARYGINPNSGRFAALNAQLGLGQAADTAGAMTRARLQAEGLGYARMQDAANMGNGLAANASTAYGVSVNAGNSAGQNRQSAGNQMGAAYGQAGNMYGGAAGSYGTAGNIYGQEFSARMMGYNAQVSAANAQNSAFGSMLGTAAGLYMSSSKDYKKNKKPIQTGKALKGIQKLNVEEWDYKDGVADEGHHVGPYAEDMKKHFGIGNGKSIPMQDAIGLTMKAVQDLANEVADMKKSKRMANGGKVHRGGGRVKGPGGGIDDKVPAMLSNGEYVLPADTVKKVGINNLDRLLQETHVPAAVQRQQQRNGMRRS